MKFKVGDRVMYIGSYKNPRGKIGTVVQIRNTGTYSVKFDDFTDGHDCDIDCGNSGMFCGESELELVKEPAYKPGDVVRINNSIFDEIILLGSDKSHEVISSNTKENSSRWYWSIKGLEKEGWFKEKYTSIKDAPVLKYKNPKFYPQKTKLPHMIVHTKTQEEYDRLMHWLDNNTDLKFGDRKPKDRVINNWDFFKETTVVCIEDCIFYCYRDDVYNNPTYKNHLYFTTQGFFEKYGREGQPLKWYKWYMGIDWAQEYQLQELQKYLKPIKTSNQSLTKKTMRKLSELSQKVRRAFSAEQKALYQAGYIDSSGEWTPYAENVAREELYTKWLDDNKADMVDRAKEELALLKEEKDSCDC